MVQCTGRGDPLWYIGSGVVAYGTSLQAPIKRHNNTVTPPINVTPSFSILPTHGCLVLPRVQSPSYIGLGGDPLSGRSDLAGVHTFLHTHQSQGVGMHTPAHHPRHMTHHTCTCHLTQCHDTTHNITPPQGGSCVCGAVRCHRPTLASCMEITPPTTTTTPIHHTTTITPHNKPQGGSSQSEAEHRCYHGAVRCHRHYRWCGCGCGCGCGPGSAAGE